MTEIISQDRPTDAGPLPEFVQPLLDSLGLGRFVDIGLPVPIGRNQNHSGTTESGQDVFVKILNGSPQDIANRLRRALSFQRFLDSGRAPGLCAPRFLGADETHGVMVFDLIADARTGRDLVLDNDFDEGIAACFGAVVGSLHAATADPTIDTSVPLFPPSDWLEALPTSVFEKSSAAALQAWALLQRDQVLINAIAALRDRANATTFVPTHCDLRLDQLLQSNGELLLIDWEEFRLADPARDVGAFVGEWVYMAITSIHSSGEEGAPEVNLTHQQIVSTISAAIDEFRPRVTAFYASYCATRKVSAEFAVRSSAYTGWHLLERMLAAAERQPTLGAIERAGAGIGRTILSTPDRFVRTLGLG